MYFLLPQLSDSILIIVNNDSGYKNEASRHKFNQVLIIVTIKEAKHSSLKSNFTCDLFVNVESSWLATIQRSFFPDRSNRKWGWCFLSAYLSNESTIQPLCFPSMCCRSSFPNYEHASVVTLLSTRQIIQSQWPRTQL